MLFQSTAGSIISEDTLRAALDRVRAADCRILYIHTGMHFGAPNPELGRTGLLTRLWDILRGLGVPTLLFPTFTFSFCNGQDFDVAQSRSRMGALNEYVRKLPGTMRSLDPLMSSAVTGLDRGLATNTGHHSIGENSIFDCLHLRGRDVRFLFFGTTASDCFTYTHYVEERLGSPYRYRREFTGNITSGGRTWHDTYILFVRYHGVVPATSGKLEADLIRRGHLRKVACGDSSISALAEPDGYSTIVEHLTADPYANIARDPRDRDTLFEVRDMVAL
jgi:aminoglycoside 3-N-acetyltransferase